MKILAIAGRNLASLGQFELALDAPPFDREGLFAITGHTGAGKSTILDAMCVALYDRIPRLPKKGGTKLAEDDTNPFTNLTIADPRNIMRRGSRTCFAATTFSGIDGQRYRARWEIPPSSRKQFKNLKKPIVTLTNLDTDFQFPGTKVEVLATIREKVGLTFEQFCRSVLLAQGDFAAFLKAGSDERAGLLERMTGTEIYRDLSIAAFERGKLEKEKLDALLLKIEAHQILTAEAKAELESACEDREQEINALKAAWTRQNDLVTGFQRTHSLQMALEKATLAHQEAEGHWLGLAETQRDLQRWERLADCREAHAEKRRLNTRLQSGLIQEKTLNEALPQLAQVVTHAEKAWQESYEQRAALRADIERQKPFIESARNLDHQIETTKKSHESLTNQHQETLTQAKAAKAEVEALEQSAKSLAQVITDTSEARQQQKDIEPLCSAWPQWRESLQRFSKLSNEVKTTARVQLNHRWRIRGLVAKVAHTEQLVTHANEGLKALTSKEETVEKKGLETQRADWHGRQQILLEKRQALAALERLNNEAKRLSQEEDKDGELSHDLVLRRERRETLQANGQQELMLISAKKDEAQGHYERVVRMSSDSAQAMRSTLEAGEACPVCGSTNHPFSSEEPLHPLVDESRARLTELNQQIQTWQTQLTNAQSEAAHDADITIQLKEASQRRASIQQELNQQISDLVPLLAPEGIPELTSDTMVQCIANMGGSLMAESIQLDETNEQINAWENELTLLRESGAILQQHCHNLKIEATQRASQLRESKQELTNNEGLLARFGCDLAPLSQQLETVMATHNDWQKRLSQDSITFITQFDQAVSRFAEISQRYDEAKISQQKIDLKLTKTREGYEWQRRQVLNLTENLAASTASYQKLQQTRQDLLNGRTVTEVETEQEIARETLETRIEFQKQALEKAQKQCHEQQTILNQLQQSLVDLRAEQASAQQKFDLELARLHLNREEVAPLLEKDIAWVQQKRNQLEGAKRLLNQAEGAKHEVSIQLVEHQQSFDADGSLEEATAQRDQIQKQKETLDERLADLRIQLKTDEETRIRIGGIQKDVDRQTTLTDLWGSMRDLIGSHDGKKFRIFAQSLTLDMLLHHANHHLSDLARRYLLERLPGSDLDLRVIDRDMGDEVRSINSLSGGETFLVSLALALGLATFTTSQTPIESLFIDEGFGALDSESLDLALDALEALHAQGRQVGVISHVQTLSERIAMQVQIRKKGGGSSSVHLQYSGVTIKD